MDEYRCTCADCCRALYDERDALRAELAAAEGRERATRALLIEIVETFRRDHFANCYWGQVRIDTFDAARAALSAAPAPAADGQED